MTKEQVMDELVEMSVQAALKVIDNYFDNKTKRHSGPCGDALASALDNLIRDAVMAEIGATSTEKSEIKK